jgi:hypothetical protein
MADKEATVFVVDLGASMGKHSQGREMTNLDWCLQYVWNKISPKVQDVSLSAVSDRFRCSAAEKQTWWVSLDSVQPVFVEFGIKS